MKQIAEILKVLSRQMSEDEIRFVASTLSEVSEIINKLETKNQELLDTLDDCCHRHGRETRKLKDRIEHLEKEKLIMDGGKQYIMNIVMKGQRNQDKAFLESIPSGYRTPFQQAYLDHITKENQ